MEISGKIKLVGGEQQVSPTFKKRDLVITTEEQYPQNILIEFKLRTSLTDNYKYRQNFDSTITNSDKSQTPQFRETAVG